MKLSFKYLTILTIAATLICCKYNPNLVNGEEVTLSGRIKRVGSEPFTSLVLCPSSDITIYLVLNDPEDKTDIEKKIGSWQTLTGTILIETVQTANGKKSFQKYSLFIE